MSHVKVTVKNVSDSLLRSEPFRSNTKKLESMLQDIPKVFGYTSKTDKAMFAYSTMFESRAKKTEIEFISETKPRFVFSFVNKDIISCETHKRIEFKKDRVPQKKFKEVLKIIKKRQFVKPRKVTIYKSSPVTSYLDINRENVTNEDRELHRVNSRICRTKPDIEEYINKTAKVVGVIQNVIAFNLHSETRCYDDSILRMETGYYVYSKTLLHWRKLGIK